jgi:hypothetical protein
MRRYYLTYSKDDYETSINVEIIAENEDEAINLLKEKVTSAKKGIIDNFNSLEHILDNNIEIVEEKKGLYHIYDEGMMNDPIIMYNMGRVAKTNEEKSKVHKLARIIAAFNAIPAGESEIDPETVELEEKEEIDANEPKIDMVINGKSFRLTKSEHKEYLNTMKRFHDTYDLAATVEKDENELIITDSLPKLDPKEFEVQFSEEDIRLMDEETRKEIKKTLIDLFVNDKQIESLDKDGYTIGEFKEYLNDTVKQLRADGLTTNFLDLNIDGENDELYMPDLPSITIEVGKDKKQRKEVEKLAKKFRKNGLEVTIIEKEGLEKVGSDKPNVNVNIVFNTKKKEEKVD